MRRRAIEKGQTLRHGQGRQTTQPRRRLRQRRPRRRVPAADEGHPAVAPHRPIHRHGASRPTTFPPRALARLRPSIQPAARPRVIRLARLGNYRRLRRTEQQPVQRRAPQHGLELGRTHHLRRRHLGHLGRRLERGTPRSLHAGGVDHRVQRPELLPRRGHRPRDILPPGDVARHRQHLAPQSPHLRRARRRLGASRIPAQPHQSAAARPGQMPRKEPPQATRTPRNEHRASGAEKIRRGSQGGHRRRCEPTPGPPRGVQPHLTPRVPRGQFRRQTRFARRRLNEPRPQPRLLLHHGREVGPKRR